MPDPSAALVAGLRLAAPQLGASAVFAYAAGPGGRLALTAASAPGADLSAVAEALGPDVAVLDVSGVVEGAQFAVGQRTERVALVALGVDLNRLDEAFDEAFAQTVALAEALSGAAFPATAAHARLLHEVATHPGSFDERLRVALAGLAEALGVDATAFCTVEGGTWAAEAAYDPAGLLPAGPVPVAGQPCAITVRADGPVAFDASASTDGPSAYLGAPVFAEGRTVGTLVAVSAAPRPEPFSADDRALCESLARWVGAAVGGRTAARRLADREAALSAFVDDAPVSMGLVVPVDDPADLRFVTVNAAAARLLGVPAADLAGRLASDAGLDETTRRAWARGCQRVLAGPAAPLSVTLDVSTPAGARVLAATLGRLDVHDTAGTPVACVSFVAEDVTEREQTLRATAERRDAFEQATADQAALFETLHHDLRTPLTTILGYADLLGDDIAPDEVASVREVLLRSGRHLLGMLDDAVAVAEAARASVSLVPVDAGRLVGAAVETCQPSARASGVALGYASEVGAAPVLLDPALVERVVQAVVGEAVRCAGGGRVETHLAEDGRHLVFDADVHGGSPAAGEASPALALAERLAERMGGTAEAGRVRLPRHPAVVVELPAAHEAAPASGAA